VGSATAPSSGAAAQAPGANNSISTQTAARSSSSSAQLTKRAAANKPPVLELVTSATLGPVVTLRRGTSYAACSPGVVPSRDAPCELGAVAMDPDGGKGGAPLNLTDQVVVCPPDECLKQGCSSSTLRAYRFSVIGLKSCTIDGSDHVGSEFVVDFWVWDSGFPALRAGVNRSVVVGPPCTEASAPYWCTNSATGSNYCSGVPCTTSSKLLPASMGAVQMVLQPPASQTLYLRYGEAAPWSLRPCPSRLDRSGCGAVAWQPASGAAGASSASLAAAQDLTSAIQVVDITPCTPSQVRPG
jgi:hypothetical protein